MELGTVVKSGDLGYRHTSDKCIWHACRVCGKEHWVLLVRGKPKDTRCVECARKSNRKNDKKDDGRGYILVWLKPNDFFYPMATVGRSANGGFVLEHRLIAAQGLGRCLHSWELVHHINGIKNDNHSENLQLVMQGQHRQITLLENRISLLEKRVTVLEVENVMLKMELQNA